MKCHRVAIRIILSKFQLKSDNTTNFQSELDSENIDNNGGGTNFAHEYSCHSIWIAINQPPIFLFLSFFFLRFALNFLLVYGCVETNASLIEKFIQIHDYRRTQHSHRMIFIFGLEKSSAHKIDVSRVWISSKHAIHATCGIEIILMRESWKSFPMKKKCMSNAKR